MVGGVIRHPSGAFIAKYDPCANDGGVPGNHLVNSARSHRNVMQNWSDYGHGLRPFFIADDLCFSEFDPITGY
jgi:hypothetical protein